MNPYTVPNNAYWVGGSWNFNLEISFRNSMIFFGNFHGILVSFESSHGPQQPLLS